MGVSSPIDDEHAPHRRSSPPLGRRVSPDGLKPNPTMLLPRPLNPLLETARPEGGIENPAMPSNAQPPINNSAIAMRILFFSRMFSLKYFNKQDPVLF